MLDVLEDEGWSDIARVTHLVVEGYRILAVLHRLQAHDLPPHFLFLDGFEHFDHDSVICQQVECLEDLGVATTPNLTNYFIVVLPVEVDCRVGVVAIPGVLFSHTDLFDGVGVVLGQLALRYLHLCRPQFRHLVHEAGAERAWVRHCR